MISDRDMKLDVLGAAACRRLDKRLLGGSWNPRGTAFAGD